MLRHFTFTLSKLPSRINTMPKTKNKSINKILKSNLKPKIPVTVYNQIQYIKNFIQWISNENYPINDDLIKILSNIKKPNKSIKKKRAPFEDDDIQKIFNSEQYVNGLIKRENDYWAPLIVLFTGARMNEILQLNISDIVKKDGVWIIDINSKEDKHLKNEDGYTRLVPIHKKLIELG